MRSLEEITNSIVKREDLLRDIVQRRYDNIVTMSELYEFAMLEQRISLGKISIANLDEYVLKWITKHDEDENNIDKDLQSKFQEFMVRCRFVVDVMPFDMFTYFMRNNTYANKWFNPVMYPEINVKNIEKEFDKCMLLAAEFAGFKYASIVYDCSYAKQFSRLLSDVEHDFVTKQEACVIAGFFKRSVKSYIKQIYGSLETNVDDDNFLMNQLLERLR